MRFSLLVFSRLCCLWIRFEFSAGLDLISVKTKQNLNNNKRIKNKQFIILAFIVISYNYRCAAKHQSLTQHRYESNGFVCGTSPFIWLVCRLHRLSIKMRKAVRNSDMRKKQPKSFCFSNKSSAAIFIGFISKERKKKTLIRSLSVCDWLSQCLFMPKKIYRLSSEQ